MNNKIFGKIDLGYDPEEIREKLNLPPIKSDSDFIYVIAIKTEKDGLYKAQNFVIEYPNVNAYNRKFEELSPEEDSPEFNFLINETAYYDCLDEDLLYDFGSNADFYPDIEDDDSKPGNVAYFKISDLSIITTKNYFGEIDSTLDYNVNKISRNDIPKHILDELEEDIVEEIER